MSPRHSHLPQLRRFQKGLGISGGFGHTPARLARCGALAVALWALNVTGSTDEAPSVLLLQTGRHPEGSRIEARLFEELGLALDDVIVRKATPTTDFIGLPLGEQFDEAAQIGEGEGAAAIVWLNWPAPGRLRLRLLKVEANGRVMRELMVGQSKHPEKDLALAVIEFLRAPSVYEPEKTTTRTTGVPGLWSPAPIEIERVPASASPPRQTLRVGFFGALGISGGGAGFGGGIGYEHRLAGRLAVGAWGEGERGPAVTDERGSVSSWRVAAGASLRHLWNLGPVSLGPELLLLLQYAHYSVGYDAEPMSTLGSLKGRAWLGIRGAVALPASLWLELTAAMGAATHQDQLQRRSDSQNVYATPWFDGRLLVALRWDFAAVGRN